MSNNWEKIIKETEFTKREPLWEKAIDWLISKKDTSPTMRLTLSQNVIQEIILAKETKSLTDIFLKLATWMNEGDNQEYLELNFEDGDGIWLGFLMAVYYDFWWNGEDWLTQQRQECHVG